MEHLIYKLTSPNGKVYIGRTKNFETRMAQHKCEAMSRRKSYPIYKAIRKYGWDNFIKEIIATAPTEETAQLLEEALIKQFDSVKNGYNSSYIGSGGDNFKGQEDKLKKFRKTMSRVTAGEKNGMYGKHHSDEAKEKQKEKAKGRFSLEWYIDRHGKEQGTELYNERCQNLSKRKMLRDKNGVFISSL